MTTRNPWDVPEFPAQGDATDSITFEAVGRALTQWERFEQILCTLFCTLLGKDTNYAAERAYGAVITFRGRADMVEAVAENYFSLHRSKNLKTKFRGLMNRAKNYGARRNEIAHGQVREWNFGRRKKGWILAPSGINTNKNSLVGHSRIKIAPRIKVARTKPKYLYSSVEIHDMADEFDGLALAAFSLVADILSAEGRRAFGPKWTKSLSATRRATGSKESNSS